MKCKLCGVEMIVDKVIEKENTEEFKYKCPNKTCSNYGYSKENLK